MFNVNEKKINNNSKKGFTFEILNGIGYLKT